MSCPQPRRQLRQGRGRDAKRSFGGAFGEPFGDRYLWNECLAAGQANAEREPVKPGTTDLQAAVWSWRDAYPAGTQAQLRAAFAEAGIEIARSWAHDCYHGWGADRLAKFERGELNEQQVQALFDAGLLGVRGGPLPGAQRVERDWDADE